MLDASQGVIAQDVHIASYALQEWKGIVLIVNKWDLIEKDGNTINEYTRAIRGPVQVPRVCPYAVYLGLDRQRVNKVIGLAETVQAERHVRIPTGEFNRLVQEALVRHRVVKQEQ